MKNTNLITLAVCTLYISACMPTLYSSSRTPLVEPNFVPITLVDDSTAVSPSTMFFYQYRFSSREDDWSMTPEWALGNLYHGGVKVVEAWYLSSTIPSSHQNFITGTLYSPLFVVGLTREDNYMEHFHYDKLDAFEPSNASKNYLERIIHYVSK